jgi:hypothetical protein
LLLTAHRRQFLWGFTGTIQCSVLNRFGDKVGIDIYGMAEIGDGEGDY